MNPEPYQTTPAWWENPLQGSPDWPNNEDSDQKRYTTPEYPLHTVTVTTDGGKSPIHTVLARGSTVTVTHTREGVLNISTTLGPHPTFTTPDSSEPEKKKSGSPKENSTPSPSSNTDTGQSAYTGLQGAGNVPAEDTGTGEVVYRENFRKAWTMLFEDTLNIVAFDNDDTGRRNGRILARALEGIVFDKWNGDYTDLNEWHKADPGGLAVSLKIFRDESRIARGMPI